MKKLDFNEGWSFTAGSTGKTLQVDLPHDAMLLEGRSAGNPSGSAGAYFGGGTYEYEKRFSLPEDWAEKRIVFRFEGIYQTAVISVNGREAGKVLYGYTTTDIDASPYLKAGENTIRVEVDNSRQPNSRWYSGAGIFRPVSMLVMDPVHIEPYGVKITTLSIDPPRLRVDVECTGGTPRVRILDGERELASAEGAGTELTLPGAKLWSADSPSLYTCAVDLIHNGQVTDSQQVRFGIRQLSWSPEGLKVNGETVKLRGGCIHHDNGVLGACGYAESEYRRVKRMKENGFNAIRSSHNPCTEAMLEACDELGMYMMDETWDMWYRHKTKEDYASWFMEGYLDDIRSMVHKDLNHPSVILYSIGNEVSEPAAAEGLKIEKEMVELLHGLDPSRPVTAGFNLMILANAAKGLQMYDGEGGLNAETANAGAEETPAMPDMSQMDSTMFNQMAMMMGSGMNHSADSDEADAAITPALELLDIAGYNYGSGRYPLEGEKHPERIIFGSETLPPDIYDNWQMVKKYPYLIGDFMWTGWDYLGEAGIGAWTDSPDAMAFDKPYPWLLGGGGVISILGDPDGEALYNQAVWGLSKGPRIAVRPVTMPDGKTFRSAWRGTNAIPSWSFRGQEGKQAIVEVYTPEGSRAELYVNGAPVGAQPVEKCKAVFETVYAPGTVEAVVYREDGTEVGRDRLESAAGKLHIAIEPEEAPVRGKLLYVNIDLRGENDVLECACDERLEVEVAGGKLLGYGSASPRTEEDYLAGRFPTYYGRSQAVIRVTGDTVTICAAGEAKRAEAVLLCKP